MIQFIKIIWNEENPYLMLVFFKKSSQYLQKELPVRVAHRIAGFRRLPFIVAINPILLSVHELYLRTFKLLIQSEPVRDSESEQRLVVSFPVFFSFHNHGCADKWERFRAYNDLHRLMEGWSSHCILYINSCKGLNVSDIAGQIRTEERK